MRDRSGARSVLLALLPALWVSACAPAEGGLPEEGEPLPAFRAARFGAEERVSLEDYRGQVVLVNLWATWCKPCRTETPFLQELAERHRDEGLRVVGVTVDSRASSGQIRTFLTEMGVTYDQLHDPEMGSMDAFGVWGLPATFLADREGTVRFVRMGPVAEDDADFRSTLEEVLR